ncbi:GHMP kinase [Paraburkholderia bonniea]|uniref:GHMP family kinase ATP-binding protein n=2 Tax=Paraburkholderia bonniea TaxID=2152891 RepID=UPI001290AFC0|nr:GHMP kinase [Paraburkholderia bonniea]
MIISRTPLRMSFVGGGSDLPAFYRKEGGAVLSTAIDKYVYVNVNKKFDSGIRIAYSKNEEVSSVRQIEHRLVRASMEYLNIDGGVEITTIADIPSKGTGLGSSSSFTVGLLHALNAYKGRYVSSEQLGADSCRIEIDICGEPIGRQDQYAAAYGGFNLMEFRPDDSVVVTPVICEPMTIKKLEQHILVFYTGITRSASALLKQQSEDITSDERKHQTLVKMVGLTYTLCDELQRNNIDAFGDILHENWMLKKSITTGISTSDIDGWYDAARAAGAKGGKILGAGAGGFLMLYAPPESHERIKHALPELSPVDVGFEPLGSRIIFYH